MSRDDRAILEEIAADMSRDPDRNRVSEMSDDELIEYITK